MASRALLVAGLALGSCCHGYGVVRSAEGPFAVLLPAVRQAVVAQPGAVVATGLDERRVHAVVARDGGQVELFVDGEAVACGSLWWNQVPDAAVLRASLALQDELLARLAAVVPGFPPAGRLRREWVGLEAPLGDRLAAVRAQLAGVAP